MAVVLILAGVLAAQDGTRTSEEKKSQALVRPVRGDLGVWRAEAGKLDTPRGDVRVSASDRIGTPRGEYALFVTEGDTMVGLKGVQVRPDKGLSVERADNRLVLKVYEGKVVVRTFETELVVQTPHGEVKARGAYFVVDVTSRETRVVAVDGTLTFTNSLGAVTIEPGQESSVQKGKKPADPKASDMERVAQDVAGHEKNLMENPGFENNLNGWTVNHEGKTVVFADAHVAHWGRKSARVELSNRVFGDDRPKWLPFFQDVEVVPGRRYLVRAYFRAETRRGEAAPVLKVQGAEEDATCKVSCEGAWKMGLVFFTAKASQARVILMAELSDSYEAKIWVDDFYLVELPEKIK